jgi:uncharacterized protein YraI
MQFKSKLLLAAIGAALAVPSYASAADIASAAMALNIRNGPGPQYSIIGAIPRNGRTIITGCIRGSLWCQVSYRGRTGWTYAQYLTASVSGRSLIVADHLNGIPTVTYTVPAPTVGTTVAVPVPAPVVTGAVIEPPAVSVPLAIAPPPPTVGSYVVSHPVAPVYINGDVVTGAALPEDVALAPVPGYEYQYAYVNGAPVLVEPATRQVEYIYR